jgi:hypothetical protein
MAQRFERGDKAVLSMRALQVAEKLRKMRRNVEERRCGRPALRKSGAVEERRFSAA